MLRIIRRVASAFYRTSRGILASLAMEFQVNMATPEGVEPPTLRSEV
jgi:hypothetical protein